MLPLDYRFRVTTGSSRRPTPIEFLHRRKWAAPEEKFLRLTSTDEITNITQQMDETDFFNVSNIFQRTLSFIFGLTDLGPRIIEATEQGALKVAIDGLLSDTKTLESAVISYNTAATHEIIAATPGKKIHVINLVFTVAGEVDITFLRAATPLTGVLDFGAAGEPRGAVIPLGIGPLVCGTNEAFNMTLGQAVLVSGFCTYYKQLA